MTIVYSREYEIPLPGHVWPTSKYRLIAERLGSAGLTFVEPVLASWDDLALVHTADYLAKLREDRLTADEIAILELPWAPGLADAFRLMVGGTCVAAAAALAEGRAAHLGGGLHHAFANHGEGFCPLNDVAVAIRTLQRRERLHRAAIIDCDVHHGNGTSLIFERDPDVFTFSIHQLHNYPVFKPRGDLDIGLEDGAADDRYLEALAAALPQAFAAGPDLVVYLAGADPFSEDRLGGLAVSKAGLVARDRLVFDAARTAGVPIVTVLAGGYAAELTDTVDIHVATIETLLATSPRG